MYQATPEKPFHLSIGALVTNKEGKILMHYWKKIFQLEEIHLLMRESMEKDEDMLDMLKRGLLEEFGVTGEVNMFLGSTVDEEFWFEEKDEALKTLVQKTTLYFHVEIISQDNTKRHGDIESESELVYLTPEEALEKAKDQAKRYPQFKSADESVIIQRYIDLTKK